MQFGYFTLRDNHSADNRSSANQLVADILDEALADGARLATKELWRQT